MKYSRDNQCDVKPGLSFLLLISSDYSTGFGGKFGVQKDRVDKSAVGWEHHEKVDQHESQKGVLVIAH